MRSFKLPLPILPLSALVFTGVAGLMVAGLKPMLVTLYITELGYSTQTTGNILTAEMLAATIGAVVISALVKRFRRQHIVRVSLILLLISDLASMLPFGLGWLVGVRLVAGMSEGMAVSVMAATITGMGNPERLMGIYNTLSMLVLAAAFTIAPMIALSGGMEAVFLALGLCAIIPIFLSGHFPEPGKNNRMATDADAAPLSYSMTACVLLGTTAFYIAWGGLWPFLGEIGRHAQMTTSEVGIVLSLSQIAGAVASLLTTLIGQRFGRTVPIFVTVLGAFACVVAILASNISVTAYEWATPLIMGCAMMFLGYLMGTVAMVDRSGRVAGLVIAIQTIGLGIGPSWGAALIARVGYVGILWVSVVLIPLTLVFLTPILLRRKTATAIAG